MLFIIAYFILVLLPSLYWYYCLFYIGIIAAFILVLLPTMFLITKKKNTNKYAGYKVNTYDLNG